MAAAGFTNALKQMENEMKESLVDLVESEFTDTCCYLKAKTLLNIG